MKAATLSRTDIDKSQAIGNLISETFKVDTIENLAHLINEGTYLCKYTRSNRLSKLALKNWLTKNPAKTEADCPDEVKNYFTYEILNVPNRSGLRLHSCSFSRQLDGCVSPVLDYADLDHDGQPDGVSSRIATKSFEDYMNREDFMLTIVNKL